MRIWTKKKQRQTESRQQSSKGCPNWKRRGIMCPKINDLREDITHTKRDRYMSRELQTSQE